MQVQLDDHEEVDVQMTPLIDCVFLLLVFFLVATTLKKIEPELPIDLPNAAIGVVMTAQPPDRLIIAIDAEGGLFVDGQSVGPGTLLTTLQNHANRDPAEDNASPPQVRLDIDQRAPFQDVVAVVDQCSSLGIRDVSFHTNSDSAND